jgi:hypothetical protein
MECKLAGAVSGREVSSGPVRPRSNQGNASVDFKPRDNSDFWTRILVLEISGVQLGLAIRSWNSGLGIQVLEFRSWNSGLGIQVLEFLLDFSWHFRISARRRHKADSLRFNGADRPARLATEQTRANRRRSCFRFGISLLQSP